MNMCDTRASQSSNTSHSSNSHKDTPTTLISHPYSHLPIITKEKSSLVPIHYINLKHDTPNVAITSSPLPVLTERELPVLAKIWGSWWWSVSCCWGVRTGVRREIFLPYEGCNLIRRFWGKVPVVEGLLFFLLKGFWRKFLELLFGFRCLRWEMF